MDRKFVFFLVVAVISISLSAKVNQKKKCREMCESNKYCKSWKYNEKTNKCKISIKKGVRRPRKSVPCETETKCEGMYDSTMYESWKFDEKSKICTMFLNQDIGSEPAEPAEPACTQKVVTNRCTPKGPPSIPQNVTEACKSIGDGLILQYNCTQTIVNDLSDPGEQTCCRDVVLNLCNASPEEVRVKNQTIPVRKLCIQDGYTDCIQQKCSINCVEKVLKELCGWVPYAPATYSNCMYQAVKVANIRTWVFPKITNCNLSNICSGAVEDLCAVVNITDDPLTDENICINLGKNLCENN